MSVYKKIQACRASIKASDLKKAGRNTYSDYDYYTPEQVDKLVYDACLSEGLFNKFELKRDEYGLYGEMSVIDIETGESQIFILATEMPKITATNATQQMGGAMTYCNRYLLMNIYDIVDNNLDFDSQKPPAPKNGNGQQTQKDDDKPWLNERNKDKTITEDFTNSINFCYEELEKGTPKKEIMKRLRSRFKVSNQTEATLFEQAEKLQINNTDIPDMVPEPPPINNDNEPAF